MSIIKAGKLYDGSGMEDIKEEEGETEEEEATSNEGEIKGSKPVNTDKGVTSKNDNFQNWIMNAYRKKRNILEKKEKKKENWNNENNKNEDDKVKNMNKSNEERIDGAELRRKTIEDEFVLKPSFQDNFLSPNFQKERTTFPSSFDTSKLTNVSPTTSPKLNDRMPVILLNESQIEEGFSESKESTIVKKRPKAMNILACILLVIVYILYLIAVLMIPSKVQEEDYWCNGDGLLILLTSFTAVGLTYYKILKPLLAKKLHKKIAKPLGMKFKFYLNRWYVNYLLYAITLGFLSAYLIYDSAKDRGRLVSIVGLFVVLFASYLCSASRSKIVYRQVIWGTVLQYIIGYFTLRNSVGKSVFECVGNKLNHYVQLSEYGIVLIFGHDDTFSLTGLAFKALPIIIFVSMCFQIARYFGILQWVIMKIGWFLSATMRTTMCESINAAANIFLGMTEAPVMIKRFLPLMTKSELHTIMAQGFATLAVGVTAVYVSIGVDASTLLSAALMNTPAALVISKMLRPEEEISRIRIRDLQIERRLESNVLEAVTKGIMKAVPLIVSIGASIIGICAFFALIDELLNWGCSLMNVQHDACSIYSIFGYTLMPLAWVLGIPWYDAYKVGRILGTKIFLNEFIAFVDLATLKKNHLFSKRSEVITTLALSGFGSLSSIGVMLAGLSSTAPDRKPDFSKLVFSAMIAGTFASLLSACVAGTLINHTVSDSTIPFATNSTL